LFVVGEKLFFFGCDDFVFYELRGLKLFMYVCNFYDFYFVELNFDFVDVGLKFDFDLVIVDMFVRFLFVFIINVIYVS